MTPFDPRSKPFNPSIEPLDRRTTCGSQDRAGRPATTFSSVRRLCTLRRCTAPLDPPSKFPPDPLMTPYRLLERKYEASLSGATPRGTSESEASEDEHGTGRGS
eukprot:1019875-Prorocentrum_minimum.AAC.1